jgi:biotin-(acetyl-CoA carboxylase) ligase
MPSPDLDLPPGFTLIRLRELGDAFSHACAVAGEAGAGTLVWVSRFDLAECAVVLEPDEPLASARRAFFAGMNAVADAVSAQCPPEFPVDFVWPDAIRFNGGLLGGGRLGWPADCAEDAVPAWLVFSFMLRAGDMAQVLPGEGAGASDGAVTLVSSDFEMVDIQALIGGFARHLMTGFDLWNERGFEPVAQAYLERLHKQKAGERRGIDVNGDLLVQVPGATGPAERVALLPALNAVSWYDRANGCPKLGYASPG